MRVETVTLDIYGKLSGFDFKSENEYLGITKSNEIITPSGNFEIDINFKFPKIRILDEDQFLVVNTRSEKTKPNGFVFNYKGKMTDKFHLGDGIEDIIIIKKNIIVSYFDEGVLGQDGPNNNGLSIFDLKGDFKFGYNKKHGQMMIMDCYCMSKICNQRIIFSAYTDFNLVELNLIDYNETVHQIPTNLRGSNAITTFNQKVYLHSPYDDEDGIYEWESGRDSATKVGDYKGRLRGIQNGRYLNYKNKEYTIIELNH